MSKHSWWRPAVVVAGVAAVTVPPVAAQAADPAAWVGDLHPGPARNLVFYGAIGLAGVLPNDSDDSDGHAVRAVRALLELINLELINVDGELRLVRQQYRLAT